METMSSSRSLKLNNGTEMPIVGLGTYQAKPGEVGDVVATAIDMGYRHIDCAALYANEPEIGKAIRDKIEAGVIKREELYVVSKLWNNKHHPDDVEAACRKTLTDLKLDYLDLYLVHWPMAFKRGEDPLPRDDEGNFLFETNIPISDTWRAMELLVEKGLTKSIGVSNFTSKQIKNILDMAKIKPVTNQVQVNPYVHQDPLLQFCKALDITLTAYTPIGMGTYIKVNENKERKALEEPKVLELAKKYNKSPAQIILTWLIQRGIAVIPKSVSAKRLEENLSVGDFTISTEDMKSMLTIGKANQVPSRIDIGGKSWVAHPDFPFKYDDPDFF